MQFSVILGWHGCLKEGYPLDWEWKKYWLNAAKSIRPFNVLHLFIFYYISNGLTDFDKISCTSLLSIKIKGRPITGENFQYVRFVSRKLLIFIWDENIFEQNYKIDLIYMFSMTAYVLPLISSLYCSFAHDQIRHIFSQNSRVYLVPASKA